ncbi:MAG: response regulator, partial [Gammaproteobacteria bacterium]
QLSLLGCTFEMVEDGELALAAWRCCDYAMLLTDCNMPNMGGLELARAIRQEEVGSGKHAPIVAITANAMEGEAERCLASGMDDFLSKPVKLDDLQRILDTWMPVPVAGGKSTAADAAAGENKQSSVNNAPQADRNDAIDDEILRSNFGNDSQIINRILSNFVKPADDIHREIKSAFESRSGEAVKRSAHKLKGAAFSVGANQLGEVCKKLELAGSNNEWEEIAGTMEQLEESMSQVRGYISSL